ncbi:MAG: ferritin family protein [Thermodesulfovibrio sp.]|uniref:ferritin family protein n=1 Tax=Thermodesulfovibrio sp. TaxID=2067987 RepID=UPI003CA4F295
MKSIELALKMETDAVKFYTEAAEKVSHPVGKKMFMTIAEDEKNHIKMIEKALEGLEIPADTLSCKQIMVYYRYV